ncbi:MAG: WD40 repeat domain-containing protein [Sulfuricurvum sp.]|nr:WD40 repeat domain-containing protein [Sulfuricurvum sp.]
MQLTTTSLHVGRSIVAFSMTQSSIIIVDTTPTVYTYTQVGKYDKHSTIKGFKSYPYRYGHSVAISNNSEYALICDSMSDRVLFLSLDKIQLVSYIRCTKTPDFCVFSPDSKYFAVANTIGRFSFYETKLCQKRGDIPFSDGISTAIFSDDSTKIIIATLDKKVHVYDLAKKHLQGTYHINDIAAALCLSKDHTTIVVYTRTGNTHTINIALKQQFLATPCTEWPTVIAHEQNSHIVLIGSRSNQLFVYTHSNGTKLGSITLDYWGITSISISREKVMVGFSDGNGIIIDVKEVIDDAANALSSNNYEKLSILASQYPLIFISLSLCQQIEERYIDIFSYKPISTEEKTGFEAITALILSNGERRHDLLQSLYTSQEIVPFMEQISCGKIEVACTAAYHSPLLRQLREFNELRTSCFSELMEQIDLLESNPLKFKDHIESMPSNCSNCIHSIIPGANILEEGYKQLISSAAASNFPAVMEITEKYGVLRQTKIYRRLINNGEALIDKTLMMISAGKMPEADMHATKLSRMKPFAATGQDFKIQIKAYESFMSACESKNLFQIFSLATLHPVLRTTEKFKEQILQFKNTILIPALHQAKLGELIKVSIIVTPYAQIEYYEEKIFALKKIALVCEIERYAPLGEENSLLAHYHECFGWDEHYQRACQRLNVIPNELMKLDEVSPEYKALLTLLGGERFMRMLPNEETEDIATNLPH